MRGLRSFLLLVLLALTLLTGVARAGDRQFVTSDGVRLHVIEAGPTAAPTIVFVPGWTMPAWIFKPQIDAFARRYHVIALDPRGQGDSDAPAAGYDYQRRGQDIADLIAALGARQVLLVGWSLGVLDSLAYVQQSGDRRLAGLVLIDNSVGEDPPPVAARPLPRRGPKLERDEQMRRFVAGMFHVSPGPAYLQALTAAALKTPAEAAARLGSYAVPRTYWKEAVYSVQKPVLYVVRPRFAGQAGNLAAKHPMAETAVFETAGHALFVDEAARFNALLDSFIRRRVWP
jgi:non-heme chloroperoxidase